MEGMLKIGIDPSRRRGQLDDFREEIQGKATLFPGVDGESRPNGGIIWGFREMCPAIYLLVMRRVTVVGSLFRCWKL